MCGQTALCVLDFSRAVLLGLACQDLFCPRENGVRKVGPPGLL